MIRFKEVECVGVKKFISKSGNECTIVYFMGDGDKDTQGLMCGQVFVPEGFKINAKEKLKVAFSGKGWEYVE